MNHPKKAFLAFVLMIVVLTSVLPAVPAQASTSYVIPPKKCYTLEWDSQMEEVRLVERECTNLDFILLPVPLSVAAAPAMTVTNGMSQIGTIAIGRLKWYVYTSLLEVPFWLIVLEAFVPDPSTEWVFDPSDTIWMSLNHPESKELIDDILSEAKKDWKNPVWKLKDSGKITLYGAKGYDDYYYVAVLHEKDKRLRFMALRVTRTYEFSGRPNGAKPLGKDGIYYLPSDLEWICSWYMAYRSKNGHGMQKLMTVGEGWKHWEGIKASWYKQVWKLGEVYLPPSPFDD